MDLYRGQFDFNNFTTQVHDFDPGITPYPSGLFWTAPIGGVHDVDLEAGSARMGVHDLKVKDFFNIPNALLRFQTPVSADATCSFEVRWSGPASDGGPVTTPGTSGHFVMSQATMTWSARNSLGFRFKSDDEGTTSAFAQLGRIRNGVFL